MPTTANTINYYVAADGTLRDGQQGSISQQPRINYGTEYSVTLTFPASTIAEGDQLQVALNRTRTFFSSASATGDAPVAAVAKHDVTAEEAAAQAVTLTLSTNTRAMIDQVNGIDHPVRGFFGVHVLRGQSFVTLAVADALMMSLESGPDAISPSLPVVDYPTREEAEQIKQDTITAQGKAEEAQGKAETAEDNAHIWAEGTDQQVEELGGEHSAKEYNRLAGVSATNAEQSATNAGQSATQAGEAKTAAETAQGKAEDAQSAAENAQGNAAKIAEGSDADVSPFGLEHSAKGWAEEAAERMTVITIPASTTSYTLQDNKHYQQVPSAVPTYTLPTATMDGLVHEITVLVDFLHVTSCSFVDASGVPVTLQSAISPQIGEAYIFRCYWYGKWRVVPLKIRNAATVSSATGVVEVSDAVAGDAFALKMTAPRSVVVNQLFDIDSVTGAVTLEGTSSNAITKSDDVLTVNRGRYGSRAYFNNTQYEFSASRKILIKAIVNLASQASLTAKGYFVELCKLNDSTVYDRVSKEVTAFDTDEVMSVVLTVPQTATYLFSIQPVGSADAYTNMVFDIKNIQVVDLTQYFNGDQTLIDSITSWDDLVAYDPRFASYVECNTGTVVGVQPQVKVSGKNLLSIAGKTKGSLSGSNVVWSELSYNKYYVGVALNNYYAENNVQNMIVGSDGSMSFSISVVGYGVVFFVDVKPNESYVLSCITDKDTYFGAKYLDASGKVIASTQLLNTLAFTAQSNCVRVAIFFIPKTKNEVVTYTNIQLELGSTATSYEPYHDGGTAQAPAPLFAVGNAADEYDVVSGVTTRKMGSYTFTGQELWTVSGAYTNVFSISTQALVEDAASSRSGGIYAIIAGYLPVVSMSNARPDLSFTLNSSSHGNVLMFKDESCTTVQDFQSKIAGKTIYYELAEPTTSQSTPSQITLQNGNNTVMQSDGGRTLAELALTYENLPAAD